MNAGTVYSDPALPCRECGDMRHFGSWDGERWICHECTDGPPLSELGQRVMVEVEREERA